MCACNRATVAEPVPDNPRVPLLNSNMGGSYGPCSDKGGPPRRECATRRTSTPLRNANGKSALHNRSTVGATLTEAAIRASRSERRLTALSGPLRLAQQRVQGRHERRVTDVRCAEARPPDPRETFRTRRHTGSHRPLLTPMASPILITSLQ